ncbi:galactan export ABC transporter permease subunit Wzm/RfbD [Gordonia araii]|uniref:galactan export ABC transporter permease subunit Wzm/RfbD n=1 Tax=Gordonia araii TaxID=263909 RepID=UPI00058FA24B|nr:ABC transporter permease [Gordonia araii]NNG97145.1 ABC transporter permease [Gordonia araii NBRC 100433]
MSVAADERVIPPPPETSDSRTFRRAFADLVDGLYNFQLWFHLGWTDIKQRYRRSVLGPLWITIATGVTAVAMGILYGTLFGFSIKEFLPYVILGLIFWNFIQNTVLDGSVVFSTNEGLIKQLPAPISVHVYRVVWRQLIIFAHNIVIFFVVLAVFRPPINWWALLFFPAMALFVLNAVWVTIVFGILSTRFRDISQLTTTIVQLAFFMTPIIWKLGPEMGNRVGSRAKLVELNPLFHYIEITRGPLLGEHVEFYHWGIVIACTALGCVAALIVLRNYRSRVAYWV